MRGTVSLVVRCHRLGYAHRDLKPNNVMLDAVGQMRLIDFGMIQYYPGDVLPEGLNIAPPAHTMDCRSTAINALCWRPLEQMYSSTMLRAGADDLSREVYERLRNGYYADSYVLGIMIMEIMMGTHFYTAGKAEEDGGVEEVIA